MFSVIIPLYNKQDSISSTIESVINQSYRDFELIIVNDGATDNSSEIVKSYNDKRINLIKKENGGVSSARNKGISVAKRKYIAFLDADDLWETDYLLEQSKLIADFQEASMWGCGWGLHKDGLKEEFSQGDIASGYRGIIGNYFDRNKRTNLFCSSAVIVSRQAFDEIGFFDERIRIGEDLDMWFRIIAKYPVVYYNRPLAYYKIDAENRAMQIIKPDLKVCLPWYIDKFDDEGEKKPEMIAYIHSFCAGYILPYYFGIKKERNAARHVIEKLDFSKIKKKYSLFYNTPFIIGKIVYVMFKLKNMLF